MVPLKKILRVQMSMVNRHPGAGHNFTHRHAHGLTLNLKSRLTSSRNREQTQLSLVFFSSARHSNRSFGILHACAVMVNQNREVPHVSTCGIMDQTHCPCLLRFHAMRGSVQLGVLFEDPLHGAPRAALKKPMHAREPNVLCLQSPKRKDATPKPTL